MELVEILDKIDLEKKEITKEDLSEDKINELKEELNYISKELHETSGECFDLSIRNNMLKQKNHFLSLILKNMIQTLVTQENHDLKWEIRNDYDINYHDNYIRYKNSTLRDLCEEMSDTDFNQDGEKSVLEFDNNIIYYHFNDNEEDIAYSEVFSDED